MSKIGIIANPASGKDIRRLVSHATTVDNYEKVKKNRGVIAIDGEREISFQRGESFIFKITRNGPVHIDIKGALELAQIEGFFNR